MEKEFDFRNHQVGDKVYHIIDGWVTIQKKEQNCFYVKSQYFNYNGKFSNIDENPTIYPDNPFGGKMIEVKIVNEFVPRELIRILPNNSVLCWGEELQKEAAFVWKEWREIEPKKELTIDEKIFILWKNFQENGSIKRNK
jgi:hypothetical protein